MRISLGIIKNKYLIWVDDKIHSKIIIKLHNFFQIEENKLAFRVKDHDFHTFDFHFINKKKI